MTAILHFTIKWALRIEQSKIIRISLMFTFLLVKSNFVGSYAHITQLSIFVIEYPARLKPTHKNFEEAFVFVSNLFFFFDSQTPGYNSKRYTGA